MIESNCTSHMTFDRSSFSNYKEDAGQSVEMGKGERTIVAGIGDIVINVIVNGATSSITLKNVLRIPSFSRQLLSFA